MKSILFLLLLWASETTIAQSINFTPNWVVGTEKILTTVNFKDDYKNDKLVSKTIDSTIFSIRVLDQSTSKYTIEVIFKNYIIQAATQFFEIAQEDLKKYNDLKLLFSINKETVEIELLNWQETQYFVQQSFEFVKTVVETKKPEMATYTPVFQSVYSKIFKSKKDAEVNLARNFEFILIPFKYEYTLNKEFSIPDSILIPLNLNDEISTTTTLELKSYNINSGNCLIKRDVKFDFSPYVNNFNSSSDTTGYDMDMSYVETIYYDSNSTWADKMIMNAVATSSDPKYGTRRRVELMSTTTLK
jgi:hypothetical protein